jgi:AraC-like DNA-binding protein
MMNDSLHKSIYGVRENISRHLVPWAEAGRITPLIMPCPMLNLPHGVSVKKKALQGARQQMKYRRPAAHMSDFLAHWPQDALNSKREHFLVWVLTGRVEMHIGSQLLSCGERSLIFIPAGMPHPDGSQSLAPAGSTCSIMWMRQCGRGLRVWISNSYDGANHYSRAGESLYFSQEQVLGVFNVLGGELEQRRLGEVYNHALLLFLYLLQQQMKEARTFNVMTYRLSNSLEGQNNDQAQHPMERACAYIQSHLSAPLTIAGVARVMHLSRATFARQFHEYTGLTFLGFVQKQRIDQAQTFLRETDWTIRTISELCSFNSYSSFNNFFVKHTGMTPARYRAQERGEIKEKRDV